MNWPRTWEPFSESSGEDYYVQQLRLELGPGHVLQNVPVRAVGTGFSDDVLFELLDGSGRFAAVHLAFNQHAGPDANWPETVLYENWDHFEREGSKFSGVE